MKVYLDASVMVALAIQEPATLEFERWLAANASERLIGSFGWGEFVDTTARRVRGRTVPLPVGLLIAAHFSSGADAWPRHPTLDADILQAGTFITADMTCGLKLGDAIHLAICRRFGATLLTGDRRQAAAAAALNIPNHLILPDPEP